MKLTSRGVGASGAQAALQRGEMCREEGGEGGAALHHPKKKTCEKRGEKLVLYAVNLNIYA